MEWFETGLVTGFLFQDRDALENESWYTGPLTEARHRGGGTERRPWQEWMLLLNYNNRAGVIFEPDRIMLVISTPVLAENRSGWTVDDWFVHLTRLGPPVSP